MAAGQILPLFRVRDERESVRAVANTITISFAQDPLIKWLRPRVPLWTRNNKGTFKWQYRRVQRAIADGIVLQSGPAAHIDRLFPSGSSESCHTEPEMLGSVAAQSSSKNDDGGEDAGVVVMLFPPAGHKRWTLERLFLLCKLSLLEVFRSVCDRGTNSERLEIMMTSHDEAIARVEMLHQLRDVWYLEVIAVHPSLQGRRLGKKAMNSVLDYINHEPVVLECTSEDNIPFYQKLGFETVEEVDLTENGEAVRLWIMLRRAPRRGHSK
ncbi:GNAT family N-acetyltransferase [Aspergillus ibericus CBS 121593]|uniref:N-acetyltransferase domain-containing protein n=1 Tax=Aspergillus ibericus CBS 121593 TaxID=1448316 RepID=A0A395GIM0_9EURO|nr:hypothetical protein BO80DRAFT_459875 [Aspergillus ibericus CBS 121593]RAK95301.1 hypothetical protein BO80DRAFT_459875 [Aspergillus ibericus CBS 121593]